MNNNNENKITNAPDVALTLWKQGCYALWRKSPKDLLYNKEKDSGYTCSICAYKAFRDPRFVDCPIYDIHAQEKSEHNKIFLVFIRIKEIIRQYILYLIYYIINF